YQDQTPAGRDPLLIKDAQVSMSCLLNTISASATKYFQKHDSKLLDDARQLSHMPDFTNHPSSAILRGYRDFLVLEGVEGLLNRVIADRANLRVEHRDHKLLPQLEIHDKTLRILEKLCEFILTPPFPIEDPSESDCVQLWVSIFAVLIKNIQMKTGETILSASKIMRKLQSLEHGGVSEGGGRKVDCIFVVDDVEISNIEFKRSKISGSEIAIQNRKNVRLARCIQEEFRAIGMENPVVFMADVQGFTGAFYRICPMGDIAIAGTTTDELVHLPTDEGGLIEFLEDSSLAVIWNYITELEISARPIRIMKQQSLTRIAKKNMAASLYRTFIPPQLERAFQEHIFLSPTKSKKPRTEEYQRICIDS
ncbi:hypothetical protein BGZ46_004597, partial [Entomortierella lignicola]